MIKILLEKNKRCEPIFKLSLSEKEILELPFIKRAIMEGKSLKGKYNYVIPIRFFQPIFNNLNKEKFEIDEKSINYFLEFSDDYDERYYYITEANGTYMRKWREEGCPTIYKILINKESKEITKEVAFQRINRII
ncbi:MAG: hypothetical protein GX275_03015 [Clostridiales bacterium]|nr:hypothetical protein [Clostridiales bacterium]